MSLAPLFASGWIVTVHALSAILALILGIAQLIGRRRGRLHKLIGYIWVTLMCGIAISSFFIHDLRVIGPFSPIHLLSIFTLAMLFVHVRNARGKNFKAHGRGMQWLFYAALIGAGAFTLLPGRDMHMVVFGQ